jgi:uncharacterized protein YndB with AHSA1/START domain
MDISRRLTSEGHMGKKILIGVVVVLGVFAAIVAMQPSTFRVERAMTMNAPPDAIYPLISDFNRWDEWSPWAKLDPAMKKEVKGTAGTPGHTYSWQGNDQVGKGMMTLTEVVPNQKVGIKLDFMEPMTSTSNTEITLKPGANGTAVSWAMTGNNNFVAKAFCLFMDMDKMVGGDFEKGLTQMKGIAEKPAEPTPPTDPGTTPTPAPGPAAP